MYIMNDFDKILWGFIFSAIGVAFGWTLNQLGQWFSSRQEDKKNLKFVLFNLLETYFIFIRSDLDKYIQKVTEKVQSKIPKEHQTAELKKMMYSLYSNILTSYLKPELSNELKVVEENYQNSIKTLATIDPLTAYYLSGKSNIIDTFDTIQGWLESLKNQFPADQTEIESGTNQVLEILKPDILHDTLIDLEKDIRNIAWKINPYVWFKSMRAIKRLKLNANENLDKEIDKLFNKLSPLFNGQ
jgi:hypothetical protein